VSDPIVVDVPPNAEFETARPRPIAPIRPSLRKVGAPGQQNPKCRLSITEQVYHQSPDSDPTGIAMHSSRWLESDEQPWVRKTRIGGEWTVLDTGFVTDPGTVVIQNAAPSFRINPTAEERREADAKTLVLAKLVHAEGCSLIPGCGPYIDEFAEIAPGESIRVSPLDLRDWRIKCRSGYAQVTITAFPK